MRLLVRFPSRPAVPIASRAGGPFSRFPALFRDILTVWFVAALAAVALLPGCALVAHASSPTDRPARDWAVDAAHNQISTLQQTGPYLRYRLRIVDRKGDQVRDEIEGPDGTVARLILRDGHALSGEQDAAERQRLTELLESPDTLEKRKRSDHTNRRLATDLIGLMPDAMLYTYAVGQPQVDSASSHQQVVLDYAPNPGWSPPNTSAEPLTGLRGRIWIDVATHTTVRLEGTVFRPVNLGWGMLAHIYPGGLIQLQQTRPDGMRWVVSHFEDALSVRALMVKSMDIRSTVDASDFQPVPAMPYADAVRLLLATPLPSH